MIFQGNGDGTFQAQDAYSTGQTPKDLLVADFGGGAALDIAVSTDSSAGTDTIMLFLGQGDGTFQTPVPYPVGIGPTTLVSADFDGVSGVDLAVLNDVGEDISILLANDDGTFQGERRITDIGGSPQQRLASDDMNNDNIPDLVVGFGSKVAFLEGTGDPSDLFLANQNIFVPSGITLLDIVVTDWDMDGNQDTVTTAATTSDGRLTFIFGNGAGGTARVSSFIHVAVYPAPKVLTTGDFDGDGDLDIAFTDDTMHSLLVRYGAGSQITGFEPFQNGTVNAYPLEPNANALLSGDFNGDGFWDVATTIPGQFGFYPGVVALYSNRDDGSFLGNVESVPVEEPRELVLGNPGPSGIPDLVVDSSDTGGGYIKVLRWDGSYSEVQSFEVPETISQMTSGALTSSGKLDVVVLPYFTDSVLVLTARPDGLFNDPVPVDVGDEAFDPVIADFNNDNNNDLLIGTGGHFSGGALKLLLGNGDGSFEPPLTVLPSGFGLHHPAAGDVNNDENMDVVVTTESQEGRTDTGFVLLGNGDGTFQTPVPISGLPDDVYFDTLSDLDGDDNLDMVTEGLFSPGDMLILMGDGLGGFGAPTLYPMGSIGWMIATDVNGDNVPDVVVISWAVNGVLVYLGVGDGTFDDPVVYMAGQVIWQVIVADLNDDGLPDIAVSGLWLDGVFIMFRIPPS